MSLSFLLSKAKTQDAQHVDKELDELFKSKVYAAPPREVKAPRVEDVKRKRKLNDEGGKSVGTRGKKPRKDVEAMEEVDGEDKENTLTDSQEPENEEDSSEDGDTDEGEDLDRASTGSESDNEDEEGEPFDASQHVHESLQPPKDTRNNQKKGLKNKYAPPDEAPAQRDLRTIFVGNLSVEVAKKRPLQKQLRRHFLSAVPTAKIESIRFRSIAFQSPTANLSETGDAAPDSAKAHAKDGREHSLVRTAVWRQSQDEKEGKDEKKFLTPNQKKKIAFINHEFHSVADTVHGYVVFAHPVPPLSPGRKPRQEVMNPYEAAQRAALQCDGSMFLDRLLRVDVVGKSSSAGLGTDPKLTIFVGNLDFASKEEDLRAFFEGVISKERGEPPPHLHEEEEGADEESGGVKKARAWVTRVRIVRDRETQLGKGFAYVQFMDRECVDEVLALGEGKLKFAKRKLRVQRCKTIPGSSVSTKHLTKDSRTRKPQEKKSKPQSQSTPQAPQSSFKKSAQRGQPSSVTPSTPVVVPKGNPKLGEKLAHLSKEERKRTKAADADRVARRLAKKKARMAMGAKGKDQASLDDKKRVRVRKGAKDNIVKSGKSNKGKEKKGRVRSEKYLAKLNTKK